MNHANSSRELQEVDQTPVEVEPASSGKPFRKLKRPVHATKRAGSPERLRGIHRRRRKKVEW